MNYFVICYDFAMVQGVFDSDVFILFLTCSVLSRKYCQMEIGWVRVSVGGYAFSIDYSQFYPSIRSVCIHRLRVHRVASLKRLWYSSISRFRLKTYETQLSQWAGV